MSPTGRWTTLGPLALVLAFTMLREGFEDLVSWLLYCCCCRYCVVVVGSTSCLLNLSRNDINKTKK